jgi:hypothetical protein
MALAAFLAARSFSSTVAGGRDWTRRIQTAASAYRSGDYP